MRLKNLGVASTVVKSLSGDTLSFAKAAIEAKVATGALTKEQGALAISMLATEKAEKGAAAGGSRLSKVFKGLKATIVAHPYIAAAAAITAVAVAVSRIRKAIKEAHLEALQKTIDAGSKAVEESKTIRELYAVYQAADEQYKKDGSNKEAYVEATNNLIDALGAEGYAVRNLSDDYYDLADAMGETVRQKLLSDIYKGIDGINAAREKLGEEYSGRGKNGFVTEHDGVYSIVSGWHPEEQAVWDNNREHAALMEIEKAIGDFYSFSYKRNLDGEYQEEVGFAFDGSPEKVYKDALTALEIMQKGVQEGKWTNKEMMDWELYQYAVYTRDRLEPEVGELLDSISATNTMLLDYQYDDLVSKSKGKLPETLDAFKEFRNTLIENTLDSNLFQGSEDEAKQAIDAYLQGLDGFENFYGAPRFRQELKSLSTDTIRYLKYGGEATDEMREELNKFLDVNEYSPEEFINLFAQVSDYIDDTGEILDKSVSEQVKDLTNLRDELATTTKAIEAYKKALEGGEKGDAAEELAKAYKSAVEAYKSGKIDTYEMRAAADLFFDRDFLASGNYDLEDVGELLTSGIWASVFATDDYANNFVNYLQEHADEFGDAIKITTDAGGNVQFAYKSVSALAEATNMSEASVIALLDALDAMGIQAMMSGEDMAELVDQLGLIPGQVVSDADGIKNIIQTLADSGLGYWDIQGTLKSLESAGMIDTSGMQDLYKWINEATGGVGELDEKGSDITFEADGSQAMGVMDELQQRVDELTGKHEIEFIISKFPFLGGGVGGLFSGGKNTGKSNATGTLNASGGKTYINELGPETVIQDGVAKEFNDGKPALVDLKPGDIVLPADITADAKRNGHKVKILKSAVTGQNVIRCPRCGTMNPKDFKTCVACGYSLTGNEKWISCPNCGARNPVGRKTCAVCGEQLQGVVWRPKNTKNPIDTPQGTGAGDPTTGAGTGSGGGGGGSSGSSSGNEKIDWIEIAINRITRKIQSLAKIAESTYKKIATRLSASKDEISKITEEIDLQRKAYDRYLEEANSVGLDEELAALVRDGTIDIREYDKSTVELINDYKKWYEKALACSDAVEDLHENLASLYSDRFENVAKDFENQLSIIEHRIEMYGKTLDTHEAKGYMASAEYYSALSEVQMENITLLQRKLEELNRYFNEAIDSGEIEEYSEAWYSMKSSIMDVEGTIADANKELIEYSNSMRDAQWGYFDYARDKVAKLTEEANFLIDLMANDDLFDDAGKFNDKGIATVGLHAQNFDTYMAQADAYFKEMRQIEEQIAKDPYNTTLIKRREELLGLQQDSIKSAESEKQAVKSLVQEGITKELEALKKLIDAYEDSLDSAKDLYEYQKKITDKTANIASIQKQLAAYANDNSEENRARVQKLQENLKKAQEDLQETEYDQYIKDQKELLSSLYDDYEETLNARLDDIESLFTDMIEMSNEHSDQINETLQAIASSVGYTISSGVDRVWADSLYDAVGKYGDELAMVNSYLGKIEEFVAAMAAANDASLVGAVKQYATGGLVDYTGLARVDGTPGRPELMLNAKDTDNFIALRDVLRETPYLSALSTKLYNGGSQSFGQGGTTIGEVHVTIPIDHVIDYNDMVSQMQRDPKFEKMLRAMTTDVAVGSSVLKKNRFQF